MKNKLQTAMILGVLICLVVSGCDESLHLKAARA